jgi:hypothetical protein
MLRKGSARLDSLKGEDMAMNKKELAEVERLKTLLALRFTADVLPDIPKPGSGSGIVNGWGVNNYSRRVYKTCSSVVYHGTNKWDKTELQNPIEQYSSALLAYRALRREVEKECARNLRVIDRKIEELEAGAEP